MTSAWKEPPGRDDRAESHHVEPDENQLEMFETAPRIRVEALPPLAGVAGEASREAIAQQPTDLAISTASKRDFLNVGGAETEELRRLEDSIRWLMNESTVRRLPRAPTLPPVRGLPRVQEESDPADDALLLNPETLFPARSSRRRGGVIRGVAKFLLASAVAAPTAYFVANWMQRAGSAAPSEVVTRSFENQVAAVAPVPRLAPADGARLANELLGAPPSEQTAMRGTLPADGSPGAAEGANQVEVTSAPEQAPAASATSPDPPSVANSATDVAANSPPPPAPAAPAKVTLSPREVAILLERGRVLFEAGDVAAARLFFRRAANAGDAAAALAMGTTYDPDVLAKHFVRGIGADPEEARMWYEKARVLGSPEGPRRIEMLAHR